MPTKDRLHTDFTPAAILVLHNLALQSSQEIVSLPVKIHEMNLNDIELCQSRGIQASFHASKIVTNPWGAADKGALPTSINLIDWDADALTRFHPVASHIDTTAIAALPASRDARIWFDDVKT